jgi:hypothetical protein
MRAYWSERQSLRVYQWRPGQWAAYCPPVSPGPKRTHDSQRTSIFHGRCTCVPGEIDLSYYLVYSKKKTLYRTSCPTILTYLWADRGIYLELGIIFVNICATLCKVEFKLVVMRTGSSQYTVHLSCGQNRISSILEVYKALTVAKSWSGQHHICLLTFGLLGPRSIRK